MAENPYVYMLVGVMGIIILGHWFPSIKNIGPDSRNVDITRLDHIQGIDFGVLSVCRQKGLM